MMRKLILILLLVLSVGLVNSADLSIKLKTDKNEYFEGEDIKLNLEVSNPNNITILGELSGKSNIGNTGFDISCLEYNFEGSRTSSLNVLSAQAQFSTSDTKVITSFSSCGGSQSQSTKTVYDNSGVVVSSDEEFVVLSPFSLKYSFNGSEFTVLSNELSIKIKKKTGEEKQEEQKEQEEQQKQEEKEKQEQQNQEQQKQESEQSGQDSSQDEDSNQNEMPEIPKGEELSQEKQQALKNNQQNQQSLSQLKNEISKISVNESKLSKQNLSFNNLSLNESLELLSENNIKELSEERKNYFWNIIGLILFFLILYLIYFKYFRKEDLLIENLSKVEVKVPYYLELLDLVLVQKDYKNQVRVLAQSVREFLFISKNLKFVPTNNIGLKITQNKMFIEILEKAERIEFARSSDELDIKELIKSLRKVYEKFTEVKKNE
jgi:hypothetical protein